MERKIKKIKILYTIPNFNTAGSGKVLYDLAKGLDKDIFDVHIACSHDKGNFFKEVEKLGLPIHFMETTCKLKPYFTFFRRLQPYQKFIKENQFAIVHSWHWSSDWTEVLASKRGGARFVFTKKAMSWGNIHWKLRSFLADYIVTINHEMQNYFPYKKDQKLIPLGLETDYYNAETFPKNKRECFTIVTVANLVPVKGIEILIDAVLELKNQEIELIIVGNDENDYAAQLKQKVIENDTKSQIRFLGKHTDIRPFLTQSDLYVIPSLNKGEGMPMALVEAMSMGLPVLGSNVSGINFVLKDFQHLMFEAGNVTELAIKIEEIINLPEEERNQLGSTLRTYVVSNFSYEKFITEHEKLYQELIQR